MHYTLFATSKDDTELIPVAASYITQVDKEAEIGIIANFPIEGTEMPFPAIEVRHTGNTPKHLLHDVLTAIREQGKDTVFIQPSVILQSPITLPSSTEAVAIYAPNGELDMSMLVWTLKAVDDMLLYLDIKYLPNLNLQQLLTRTILGAVGTHLHALPPTSVQYADRQLRPIEPGTLVYNAASQTILDTLASAKLPMHANIARMMQTVAEYKNTIKPIQYHE